MTSEHVALLIPLCVLTTAGVARAAEIPANPVTVRVYEAAQLDPSVKTAALNLARTTLAAATVDVSWKPCGPGAGAALCDRPPAGELVLRIVHSTVRYDRRSLPLGDALVDTASADAILATVYLDRVVRVAKAARMDTRTLLGYAIAHELGHLLLASSSHNTRGLMRPIWRDEELRSARSADWSFTAQEIAAIRRR
ncbi:MAG TPA: hypothetical protein VHJ58_14285 [Vicinamibacterales bacterium]|jgi:hypothetical protein|nr:hypothetical protein [Vicinamibacterales bacterium]